MQIFVNLPTDRKSELTPHHEYYAALFDILSSTEPNAGVVQNYAYWFSCQKVHDNFWFLFPNFGYFYVPLHSLVNRQLL